jgi:C4-dicarboxylate transporter DctQ subunit
MQRMAEWYYRLLQALAGIGAACIAFVFIAVIFDVTVRTLRFGSTSWVAPMTEYALLYTVTLASPWLIRKRGHIVIESLVEFLPHAVRRLTERLVCLLCLLMCLVLLYYFAASGLEAYLWNEKDIRAITIPRWLMYLPFTVMFALSAVEFGRFLIGRDDFFTGHGTQTDRM